MERAGAETPPATGAVSSSPDGAGAGGANRASASSGVTTSNRKRFWRICSSIASFMASKSVKDSFLYSMRGSRWP
jgi:hypothetical protein